jgi:hypothetical protein
MGGNQFSGHAERIKAAKGECVLKLAHSKWRDARNGAARKNAHRQLLRY